MRSFRISGFVAAALLLGGLLFVMLRFPEKGLPDLPGETISGKSDRRDREGELSKKGLSAPAGEEPEDPSRPLALPDPGLGMELGAPGAGVGEPTALAPLSLKLRVTSCPALLSFTVSCLGSISRTWMSPWASSSPSVR